MDSSTDDERNVDEQLDEQQRRLDEERRRPLISNHTNNARVDPEPAGGPQAARESTVLESDVETVTDPVKGTSENS